MEKDNKPHGRTIFDLIAEHPKWVLVFFILTLFTSITIAIIIVKNNYDVNTPYVSFKHAKDTSVIKQTEYVTHKNDTNTFKIRQSKHSYKILTHSKISKETIVTQPMISVISDHQSGGQTAYQITN